MLKAELCFSYLTIESKAVPPVELRSKMADWFFGCDLCQTVCPWNEKVFRKKGLPQQPALSTDSFLSLSESEKNELIHFFQFILSSSNKKMTKHFQGSALLRAGGNGLKRNALIVIGNRKLSVLKPEVEKQIENSKFTELATWCLAQFN